MLEIMAPEGAAPEGMAPEGIAPDGAEPVLFPPGPPDPPPIPLSALATPPSAVSDAAPEMVCSEVRSMPKATHPKTPAEISLPRREYSITGSVVAASSLKIWSAELRVMSWVLVE